MSQPSSLIIERFRRLPRRSDDRWQGGLARLPSWIERGPDRKPYRPWAGIWVSRKTGFIHLKMEPASGAHDWTLALDALVEFGLNQSLAGYRPGGLEVADGELGARLLDAVGDADMTLTVLRDLPAVRRVLAEMGHQMAGAPLPPGALDVPGVTVDRMLAFAEAAKRFYEAAPWRHLSDEDLIHVDAPAVERGLNHVAVLGAAGHTFGLGFFESAADYAEMEEQPGPGPSIARARWSLFYGPISEIPLDDADLWDEHRLPVAGDDAYPVAVRFSPDGKLRRPDAGVLSYLEGLLRALAETTEDEMDQGRWMGQVETSDGPVTYQLSMPHLLEPLDAPGVRPRGVPDRRATERVSWEVDRFIASTPLEKAQEMAYRAFEARGRRRILSARKALELSPDCADAYVILAEQTGNLAQARDLYAQGVAAGERALGARIFAEEAGRFWGLIATRPYMRARFGLAQCLEALAHPDEAISHYRELLRLNPDDNQGVRYSVLVALLAGGRDDEAGALLRQFSDDPTAMWRYGWALWAFRGEGDSRAARESLRRAARANRGVRRYLTGKEALPDTDPPSYAPGSDEEAVICARALADVWQTTPGAVEWLRADARAKRSRKQRKL